jgi:hypothetical protein
MPTDLLPAFFDFVNLPLISFFFCRSLTLILIALFVILIILVIDLTFIMPLFLKFFSFMHFFFPQISFYSYFQFPPSYFIHQLYIFTLPHHIELIGWYSQ